LAQRDFNVTIKRNPLDDPRELQVKAELGDLATEAGMLAGGGPPTHRPLVPNSIRLEDGFLFWDYVATEGPSPPFKEVDPVGALDRFVRIQSDQDVLEFARRFGPLLLCSHGLPPLHPAQGDQEDPALIRQSCRPVKREALGRWRYYVRQARAIVFISGSMRQGEPGPRDAWEELFQSQPKIDGGFPEDTRNLIDKLCQAHEKELTAAATWIYLKPFLDTWLTLGGLRLEISTYWHPLTSPPRVQIAGSGTFGVLALQLLASITGSQGFYPCHACGDPYRPARRPQAGRRSYCDRPECKKWGAAARKRKERQRI